MCNGSDDDDFNDDDDDSGDDGSDDDGGDDNSDDDRYSHLFGSAGLKARLYPKAIQRKVITQQIDDLKKDK
jgi:hypothetical protein